MTDLGDLVQRTADRLVKDRVGVVVAAVAGGSTEIRGAGRAGGDPTAVPGAGAGAAPGAGTVFEIGSVTKVFTALALARLAGAGAVDLDEPLSRLLPADATVPSRAGVEITLRHLATHRSGLPRLPTGMLLPALLHPYRPDPYADCTTERLLRALAATRLGATPGSRFRYSNFGAGLLGLALAHRAGISYADLIDREISTPLRLADTTTDAAGRSAQGHTARRKPTPAWHLADLAGAGALRSTAADLATFLRAQLGDGSGELAEAIRLTHEVKHPTSPFTWIHLGWMGRRLHRRQGGHLQIWHNGGTGGFTSFAAFDPEKKVAVAALSNTQRSVDSEAFALLQALQ
jgi:CubicO group peptidase (beta-lactamase class C family)